MATNRNAYLIWKSLRNFILASVLTAAAGQLASTFDAIVLAQFIGEEAVSALSLIMPVTTFISCLGLMLAFGANALAAQAIGHHHLDRASAIFSTAIWSILVFGILASLLLWIGIPYIVMAITDEPVLRTLPAAYLSVYLAGAWLEMLSYALCLFVATDGHPRYVTIAVLTGVIVNIVIDVLTVGFLDWGIKGTAWGTLAQFTVNIMILSLYFLRPSCSFRLSLPTGRWRLLVKNVKEGATVTISNILMAVTVLLVTNIMFDALGERGLFFWSICLQMLLVSAVFINGVMEALFAIGGILLGEHDLYSLNMLARRCLISISAQILLLIILMWIPNVVGIMFGVEDVLEMAYLNAVLRIFSLLLLPFALTLILVACYQVLERIALSAVIAITQLSVLIVSVSLFAYYVPDYVWYAFPLAGFMFLGCQLLYSYKYSRKRDCQVSGLTLIPYSEGGHSLNLSVRYQLDEVTNALEQIVAFLEEMGINPHRVFDLHLCCEELMTNIAQHSKGRVTHHSFDVHVFVMADRVRLTLRDGGRPFDPIRAGKTTDAEQPDSDIPNLGLLIAANIIPDISYKYMYGLNIVLIKVN